MAGGKEQVMKTLAAKQAFPQPDVLLVAATIAAILTLLPVTAHQLGFLDHLPDPPGPFFASDAITESKAAYPLGIPDGPLGLVSYGVTLGLVLLSRQNRGWRKVLNHKLCADGSVAAFNVVKQFISFRKACSWCTGTAACTAVMLLANRKAPR
jgi:uncharacterized membrane protein